VSILNADPALVGVIIQSRSTRFGVWYYERHVSRMLHELGFSHMTARPQYVGQDPETIERFKKIPGDDGRDHRQAARRGNPGNLVPGWTRRRRPEAA
jgi:hypothetical protein